jgi:hypothetical protein
MSTVSKLKRFVSETTLCVCGHPYGDHIAKTPHRCTEDSISRPNHKCSCIQFKQPVGPLPDSIAAEILSESADHELQRVLGSLPSATDNFDLS